MEDANYYLDLATPYIQGLATNFEKSLADRPNAKAYFGEYINTLKNNTFHIDEKNPGNRDLDKSINKLVDPTAPIFYDMVKNLNNNPDCNTFIFCYGVLENEAYKFGSSGIGWNEYKQVRMLLSTRWMNWQKGNALSATFDLDQDIDKNNCKEITNTMDKLLVDAATKIGNGVTPDDLRQVINLSFTYKSLTPFHDYTRTDLKHTNCNLAEYSRFQINCNIYDKMQAAKEVMNLEQTQVVDQGLTR